MAFNSPSGKAHAPGQGGQIHVIFVHIIFDGRGFTAEYPGPGRFYHPDMVSAGAFFNFFSTFICGGIIDSLRVELHPEGCADRRAKRQNRVRQSAAPKISRIFPGIFAGDLRNVAAGDVLF